MENNHRRPRTYTKRDLVRRVAAANNETLHEASRWVDQVFAVLRDIMITADPSLRIEIRDFGVMEVKPTKSKPQARNPKSGTVIFVPSRRKTHFKPSKLLKRFLSQPLNGETIAESSSLHRSNN
ncbi:MAG: integration host factor subunit beta [Ignavibacteria bacterium]|nr:integration host factor subunit beta [Ignavibacteria bacterium]